MQQAFCIANATVRSLQLFFPSTLDICLPHHCFLQVLYTDKFSFYIKLTFFLRRSTFQPYLLFHHCTPCWLLTTVITAVMFSPICRNANFGVDLKRCTRLVLITIVMFLIVSPLDKPAKQVQELLLLCMWQTRLQLIHYNTPLNNHEKELRLQRELPLFFPGTTPVHLSVSQ